MQSDGKRSTSVNHRNMIIQVENTKESTEKTLELMSAFSKFTGYKFNI